MLAVDSVYRYEDMIADLINVAADLAYENGENGVTVCDIRRRALEEGILTGFESNKDLSFLGYIPRKAGLVPTERTRRTDIKESHRHKQRVYVRPRPSSVPAMV